MKELNILVIGLGGQGVLTASNIIADVFFKQGADVKKSDTKGMSQRGSEVVSQIRIGKKIRSPVIKKGDINFILGFDEKRIKKNDHAKIIIADSNILLLKKFSKFFDINQEKWIESIKEFIPEKYLEENIKLFKL